MVGHKASLTNNPLGDPSSPIHCLAAEFQDYLYFPDPSPLYVVIGCMAANMMKGNTVWLMLVGAPACGGTELLNSLLGVPGVHSISTLKGPSTLLSGVGKKDRAKDATGGVLREVGERGALVLKDFTSILSCPHEPLRETLGALREIYDGRWDRTVGTEGGRTLTWTGRIALLTKCTQAIDRHNQLIGEMGERMVLFRYPYTDGWGESKAALAIRDPERAREEMQELVKAFFEALDLDWNSETPRRELEMGEWTRIISIATFAARCRSAVIRDDRDRTVVDVPQPETPTRLATVLGQLYLGLELIGLEESERWRLMGKVALDCMPQIRRVAVDTVRFREAAGVDSTVDDVQMEMKCSRSVVLRVMEDLEVHGVIEKQKGKALWRMSKWAKGEMEKGWK